MSVKHIAAIACLFATPLSAQAVNEHTLVTIPASSNANAGIPNWARPPAARDDSSTLAARHVDLHLATIALLGFTAGGAGLGACVGGLVDLAGGTPIPPRNLERGFYIGAALGFGLAVWAIAKSPRINRPDRRNAIAGN
jgi:hypothetical protein